MKRFPMGGYNALLSPLSNGWIVQVNNCGAPNFGVYTSTGQQMCEMVWMDENNEGCFIVMELECCADWP